MVMIPYKSVAAALVLVILFGPVGLFYSSLVGGIIMSIFGLVAIGTMASMHSPLPMATVYLFSLLWGMISVRLYNGKMLKIAVNGCLSDAHQKAKSYSSFFRRKAAKKNEDLKVEGSNNDDDASWKL